MLLNQPLSKKAHADLEEGGKIPAPVIENSELRTSATRSPPERENNLMSERKDA